MTERLGQFVGKVILGSEGAYVQELFGDSSARRQWSLERAGATEVPVGAVVLVESGQPARLLAADDSPYGDLYDILAKYQLNPVFPDAVISETNEWIANPGLSDPELVDLTAVPFATIDGESSRDLDQAVYVSEENQILIVCYALADASYYVPVGSELWHEAQRRAASYYLPGLMVPMLPRALSEGLVSLNPDVERRALVFETRLSNIGQVESTRVRRAKIRSRAKLSFGRVQRFYDKNERFSDPELNQSLELLRRVGEARMQDAHERDVVRFRRTEMSAHVAGKQARRFIATAAVRRAVEAYNEQLSLLCNAEGARLLEESAHKPYVEAIYRVHPAPERERLVELRGLVKSIADAHGLAPDVWYWRDDQALSDYLKALPREGALGRVASAIHRQAVMVNVRSQYQDEPGRHFGVGADVYARFSAPMRELVGVFLHAELVQSLGNDGTEDDQLRERVVERANHAKQVQRRVNNEANLLVLDQLFGDELSQPIAERGLAATVMGLTASKVYVEFEEPPIDAKVRLRDIKNHRSSERVSVAEDGSRLLLDDGCLCRIGDAVTVVVLAHDEKRGRWALSLR